jgi:hypothetical protein
MLAFSQRYQSPHAVRFLMPANTSPAPRQREFQRAIAAF